MIQYFWSWFKNALHNEKPWNIHPLKTHTNQVHQELTMLYPPENNTLAIKNERNVIINIGLRVLIPIGALFLIIL